MGLNRDREGDGGENLAIGFGRSLGAWAALVVQGAAAEGHRGSAEGRVVRIGWKPKREREIGGQQPLISNVLVNIQQCL